MFEHITLRRSETGLPLSAGQIAEALLYYQKVHVFIDQSTLFNLIRQIGVGRILSLLRRTDFSAVYCEEMLGTQTDSVGASQFHNYVAFTLTGNIEHGTFKNKYDRLQYGLECQGISKKDAKQFAKNFLDLAPIRKYSGNYFLPNGIAEAGKIDLLDLDYAKKAIREYIAHIAGGYAVDSEFKFDVLSAELGMFVYTNIDLKRINSTRTRLVATVEPITIAHLLTGLLEARADLAIASFYGGDFVTSDVTSSIIRLRHAELLHRTKLNFEARDQFTEVVLPDSPSLAEVIDSGERTFDEFLVLLDRAKKFKNWLKGVNPDKGLIKTYLKDVSSEDWIQRLPSKILRYVFTQTAELASPAAGTAAGIIDTFLVEKLFSGWKPNHFTTRKLSKFVQVD